MSIIAEVASTKRFYGKMRELQMDDGATSWDIEHLGANLDHTTVVGDRYKGPGERSLYSLFCFLSYILIDSVPF